MLDCLQPEAVVRGAHPTCSELVALEEDAAVRIVSYVVECALKDLRPDMPLRAVFRPLRYPGVAAEVIAPLFAPTRKL